MNGQPSILLIAAMEQEASPLLQALGFSPLQEEVRRELPFRRFEAKVQGMRVLLSLNGRDKRFGNENVGLEIAALNAYDSIHRFDPQLVINFGTAGSYQHPDVAVGKVFLSQDKFFFHDHRIPLAGYEEYGRGHLPGMNTESLAQQLGLPRASVSSGSSLDFTDRDLEEIQRSGATLKEMEAGAIAWACYLLDTPFFAVKSVTNIVDRKVSSASEFEKNFQTAVDSLTDATQRVVHALVAESTSLLAGK
jgi:nucleoside phosphorylase